MKPLNPRMTTNDSAPSRATDAPPWRGPEPAGSRAQADRPADRPASSRDDPGAVEYASWFDVPRAPAS